MSWSSRVWRPWSTVIDVLEWNPEGKIYEKITVSQKNFQLLGIDGLENVWVKIIKNGV